MNYHRYYKERLVSFLITFESNSNSFTSRWIENKFDSLDGERIMSCENKFRENNRFSSIKNKRYDNKKNYTSK